MLMELDDRDWRVRFLIQDRAAAFRRALNVLLATEKAKVIGTPAQAPTRAS